MSSILTGVHYISDLHFWHDFWSGLMSSIHFCCGSLSEHFWNIFYSGSWSMSDHSCCGSMSEYSHLWFNAEHSYCGGSMSARILSVVHWRPSILAAVHCPSNLLFNRRAFLQWLNIVMQKYMPGLQNLYAAYVGVAFHVFFFSCQ